MSSTPEVAGRKDMITVTFAVVVFSLLVQGLTMTPLLRKTGDIR